MESRWRPSQSLGRQRDPRPGADGGRGHTLAFSNARLLVAWQPAPVGRRRVGGVRFRTTQSNDTSCFRSAFCFPLLFLALLFPAFPDTAFLFLPRLCFAFLCIALLCFAVLGFFCRQSHRLFVCLFPMGRSIHLQKHKPSHAQLGLSIAEQLSPQSWRVGGARQALFRVSPHCPAIHHVPPAANHLGPVGG